jgi:hypothetical protein
MSKAGITHVCRVCRVLVLGTAWLWPAAASAQATGPYLLQRLHTDLALNPSQEEGWKSFEQAYQVNPVDIARERDAAAKMPSLTGPQRVDLAIGLSEQDLADLRHRGDTLKTFYASLSPEQQKTFDRDTLPPGAGRY